MRCGVRIVRMPREIACRLCSDHEQLLGVLYRVIRCDVKSPAYREPIILKKKKKSIIDWLTGMASGRCAADYCTVPELKKDS